MCAVSVRSPAPRIHSTGGGWCSGTRARKQQAGRQAGKQAASVRLLSLLLLGSLLSVCFWCLCAVNTISAAAHHRCLQQLSRQQCCRSLLVPQPRTAAAPAPPTHCTCDTLTCQAGWRHRRRCCRTRGCRRRHTACCPVCSRTSGQYQQRSPPVHHQRRVGNQRRAGWRRRRRCCRRRGCRRMRTACCPVCSRTSGRCQQRSPQGHQRRRPSTLTCQRRAPGRSRRCCSPACTAACAAAQGGGRAGRHG